MTAIIPRAKDEQKAEMKQRCGCSYGQTDNGLGLLLPIPVPIPYRQTASQFVRQPIRKAITPLPVTSAMETTEIRKGSKYVAIGILAMLLLLMLRRGN